METVTIHTAKTTLSQLLARVEAGEEIEHRGNGLADPQDVASICLLVGDIAKAPQQLEVEGDRERAGAGAT